MQLLADYYSKHRDEMVDRVAVWLRGDRMTAEDMVQQTFLCLLTGDRLITAVTLPALVFTTLRRQIIDLWRRRRHETDGEHLLASSTVASDDDPQSLLSASDIHALLEHRMARLDADSQAIARLSVIEGMKVGDISEELGLKYKAVEYRLGTVRRQLRQYMARRLA